MAEKKTTRAQQAREKSQASMDKPKKTPGTVKIRGVRKIKGQELPSFTQKLAAMLSAGLPLVECLAALQEQTENPEFKKLVKSLRESVEGGKSFAEALQDYDYIFSELYISMVRAGELGGSLAEVMERLASYLESSAELKRKLKSALTYPVVVMILAGVLTVGMLIFIVPRFASIYDDFDAALPGPTQMLVNVSDIMRQYTPFVIIAGIILVIIFKKLLKTEQGSFQFDRFLLRVPIAGKLIGKIAMARMSRTFASLLRSGVPILKALDIVGKATGNKYLGRALSKCTNDIEGGATIASALDGSKRFPPMVIHMVGAGEKTGDVDGMLEKVADFYEGEVSSSLEALSSTIEPLLMALLGIVIGGIVLCMFLPIFKMHEIVGA
ncbi:MAG: type II secretion system F family protein [Lentisphaeria bacterium]